MNYNINQAFIGINIIEDHNLLETVVTEVERTWKERLFTFPWHPGKTHKTVVSSKPSTTIIQFEGKLIMHPAMAAEIRKLK